MRQEPYDQEFECWASLLAEVPGISTGDCGEPWAAVQSCLLSPATLSPSIQHPAWFSGPLGVAVKLPDSF